MKIILSDLTLTRVYNYKPLEKTTYNGYVNYSGTQLIARDTARTFKYDCSNIKYLKVISEDNKNNSAPYARFVDGNGTLVGTVITYPRKAETEYSVPNGAVEFQITDTYGNKTNQVTVYGKKE